MTQTRYITLGVEPGPGADAGEYENAALSLLAELRQAGPAFEVLPQPAAADGTSKDAGQLIAVTGQVVVALASGGTLVALVNAIQGWLLRNSGKEATVEIGGDKLVLKGASDKQISALISAFAARHKA